MGRLERLRSKKKKKQKKQHKMAGVRHAGGGGSDPERCDSPSARTEEQYSSCTNNSCDETLTLCASSSLTSPAKGMDPTPIRSPTDEVEVTHRLSCLNFSVLPQDSMVRLDEDHCRPAKGSHDAPSVAGIPHYTNRDYDLLSDVDLYSEMTSTTHLDLLPMLSDQDMEGAGPYLRHTRKRPARRKASRRAKKFRHISNRDSSKASSAMATQQPLPLNFVRTSSREACQNLRDATPTSKLTRTRSLRRRAKRYQHDDDLCCFSDTSVVLDTDTPSLFNRDLIARSSCDISSGGNRDDLLAMDEGDIFEATPPAMEEGCMGDQLLAESELSDTSSDSGCEGDDEESSVEGPALPISAPYCHKPSVHPQPPSVPPNLLHWWDTSRGIPVDPSQQDESFQQIMNRAYPLLTPEGKHNMDTVCSTGFKHPGRLGMCGRGTIGGQGSTMGGGGGGSSGGRKKRCKPRELASPLTLRTVNEKMMSFIQEQSPPGAELKFNLVSRALCKTISSLAHVYQLDCFIEHKRRLPVASPVLKKTGLTRLASKEEIEPILRRHGQDGFVTSLPMSHPRSKLQDSPMSHSHSGGGVLVGGGCEALDESNLGNRMLQDMGWRPGSGLGAERSGRTSPVKAYLRTKRSGLGYS